MPFDVRPQAAGDLKFEMLGVHAAASDSDAEDESEEKAVVANSDEKDWSAFHIKYISKIQSIQQYGSKSHLHRMFWYEFFFGNAE